MFTALDPLREPLLAARLLREEILGFPTPPGSRAALLARFPSTAGPGDAPPEALVAAAELGGVDDFLDIPRPALTELARLCGGSDLRRGPGEAFHGRPAPPAGEIPALFEELLATVNAPRAVEVWSPPVRAFAVHFLLRLVQPFAAPAAAFARSAEALVLASDGFDPRRMSLPGPAGVGADRARPDADAFARERVDALVDALGRTRDELRDCTARGLLRDWACRRGSGLNERQRVALAWLDEPGRTLTFRAFVTLVSARGPSLRSLQRDWRALRADRWIEEDGRGAFVLSTAPLEWGTSDT